MTNVIYAVAVLGALGLVFGVVLAFAARVFAVETDERREAIVEALPGANCGGCGYAGCGAYATAIVAGDAHCNACIPGGSEVSAKIADIMGIAAEKTERRKAVISCAGSLSHEKKKLHYTGIEDCLAAMRIGGGTGEGACPYGCLGYGSCVRVCAFDAIRIIDGVAVIDHEKCTGCMTCAAVCPKKLIEATPYDAKIIIPCVSKDGGKLLRDYCDIGCIACRICEKTCPAGAITVESNRAVIDYEKCTSCGECAEKCPRGTIRRV